MIFGIGAGAAEPVRGTTTGAARRGAPGGADGGAGGAPTPPPPGRPATAPASTATPGGPGGGAGPRRQRGAGGGGGRRPRGPARGPGGGRGGEGDRGGPGWGGIVHAGAVAVPGTTPPKGGNPGPKRAQSGARVLVVAADLADRAAEVAPGLPDLAHVAVVGTAGGPPPGLGATAHAWDDLLAADPAPPRCRPARRPGHLRLHRRHHRPVQGLHAEPQLPRGPGPPDRHLLGADRRRRRVDPAAPVPLQRHRDRVLGPLVYGGRAAIYRRFSVSNFWPR